MWLRALAGTVMRMGKHRVENDRDATTAPEAEDTPEMRGSFVGTGLDEYGDFSTSRWEGAEAENTDG